MNELNNIFGDDENNELNGTEGDDLLFGDLGSDTITGDAGMDIFAYAGDPFEGQDVSDPERQIIAEEDFITDFDFTEDKYRFNSDDFGVAEDVTFAAIDANAGGELSIAPGTNVVALLSSDNDNNPDTPFIAGTAANEIAELTVEDGAGFFVYYNSDLGLNRLVYSTNLNDSAADLKVISRQTDLTGQDAIDALSNFSADNFEFEAVQVAAPIIGDDENNELNGTEGNDLLFGDLGSDTITGGTGMDIFAYTGDPFEGQDVSDPERQIIAEEDFLSDFNFTEDKYRFNPDDFGVAEDVNFVAVDANNPDASIALGINIVTLLNSDNDDNPETPFIAGTAADQIAELTSEDGAGFFVYYNSDLGLNRLVYSSNLNDAAADLKVISRQTDLTGQDAIDALSNFSADNFEFEAVQINENGGDKAAENTVYRYFNPDAGVHFYTNDEVERESVGSLNNYVPEGESYVAVDPMTGGAEEVYRFYNKNTGVHLYTTSETERDNIQNNSDSFSFEGTAFYAFEQQVEDSIPIYRFYEPTIGVHFYTPNEEEKMSVEENLPNYNSEGIAYYAYPIEGNEM